MKRPSFRISHSLFASVVLLAIEFIVVHVGLFVTPLILLLAAFGAAMTIYVATEAIEEVQGSRHLFIMLTAVIVQFVLFFAFQYWFLTSVQVASFSLFGAFDFFLASLMVFVFNPISLPATTAGQILLSINTIGALGLVLFVLQNISQFRRKSLDSHE
jgi:hypothetical protein